MNFDKLGQIFDQLTEAQLRQVHSMVVDRINYKVRMRTRSAAMQFSRGDLAEFDTKEGRRVRVRVDKINQKTANATEVALNDKSRPGLIWRVGITALQRITKESQAEGAGTW